MEIKKIRKVILFCLINTINIVCLYSQTVVNKDSAIFKKTVGEYEILKIKSRESFYIIYAMRNDTIYKILSEKQDKYYPKCLKIHRGKKYKMKLQSLFPRYFGNQKLLPPGTTGRMGLSFCGETVDLETEKNIWDIFEATNLRSLYIIEELDQSHIELFDKPFE